MTGPAPVCYKCKHFKENADKPICDAFPAGIPEAIYYEGHDHNKPYPGDNGIQFEAK